MTMAKEDTHDESKLRTRHWIIKDGNDHEQEVKGEGMSQLYLLF